MIGHAWLITISHHPCPILAVLLAAVCAEATASVSAIAPVLASVFMFVAGALIGAGVLDVSLPLASVILGVILGDGLAYEVGRRYHADIGPWLQASGHNDNWVRGEQFVERHGVQSLARARLCAPVRPLVPRLYGTARMGRLKFYAISLASALAWTLVGFAPRTGRWLVGWRGRSNQSAHDVRDDCPGNTLTVRNLIDMGLQQVQAGSEKISCRNDEESFS